MNVKFIFMSLIVLGLIFNITSFSDLAFADKPDKEEAKAERKEVKVQREEVKVQREEVKVQREIDREEVKVQREEVKVQREEVKVQREIDREVKVQREEIKEFVDSTIITTSSTTTICHIPPGNPGNNHTITIGNSAVSAHIGHGDEPISCELVNWEEDGSSTNEEIREFVDSTIITTSSTTTICHIPPGNPGNNHTITIGNSAVSAHIGHGDKPTSCELANWEEDGSNANEQELKNTEMDENLVDEITKQIANLQQRLQKLLGI